MHVRVVGHLFEPTGYGELGRLLVAALSANGHLVTPIPMVEHPEPATRFGKRGELVDRLIGEAAGVGVPVDTNLLVTVAERFDWYMLPEIPNVGFTMWEGDRVPESKVYSCNRLDRILTPTEFGRIAFERSGVTVPVRVVHPCVDPADYDNALVDTERGGDRRPFTFLSVFEWHHPHKDPRSLLLAYLSEFDARERVLLRVKTFSRWSDVSGADVADEVRDVRRELGRGEYPPIELLTGSLATSEVQELYRVSDCYVATHRAEGWGLPIWEAMASGLPTIATRYSGNMEYMTDENSYLVDFCHETKRVDLRDLRLKMRRVVENEEERGRLARRARSDTLAYTPEKTVAMLVEALR